MNNVKVRTIHQKGLLEIRDKRMDYQRGYVEIFTHNHSLSPEVTNIINLRKTYGIQSDLSSATYPSWPKKSLKMVAARLVYIFGFLYYWNNLDYSVGSLTAFLQVNFNTNEVVQALTLQITVDYEVIALLISKPNKKLN